MRKPLLVRLVEALEAEARHAALVRKARPEDAIRAVVVRRLERLRKVGPIKEGRRPTPEEEAKASLAMLHAWWPEISPEAETRLGVFLADRGLPGLPERETPERKSPTDGGRRRTGPKPRP